MDLPLRINYEMPYLAHTYYEILTQVFEEFPFLFEKGKNLTN